MAAPCGVKSGCRCPGSRATKLVYLPGDRELCQVLQLRRGRHEAPTAGGPSGFSTCRVRLTVVMAIQPNSGEVAWGSRDAQPVGRGDTAREAGRGDRRSSSGVNDAGDGSKFGLRLGRLTTPFRCASASQPATSRETGMFAICCWLPGLRVSSASARAFPAERKRCAIEITIAIALSLGNAERFVTDAFLRCCSAAPAVSLLVSSKDNNRSIV